MQQACPSGPRFATVRWTPARLIVLGAALGFGSVTLNAAVAVSANLALLAGTPITLPAWLLLVDAALVDLLVPVGFFLVLCGILIAVRSFRPPGRSAAFRLALGGAGVNLAAGLLLGVVRFALYVLPPELVTLDLLRNVVMVFFLGTVAVGAGLLLALGGLAMIVREEDMVRSAPSGVRVRTRRVRGIATSKTGTVDP